MNILTFDIEDWFHILDNESTRTEKEWGNFDSRIHRNMEVIFEILGRNSQKATFFCLGWIAEKYPDIIRSISDNGFELGSHSHLHQLVYEQSIRNFKADLIKSIDTLEQISGRKIRYYRAPGFSIGKINSEVFEILARSGIEVDCSVFPASRQHGGFPTFGTCNPSLIRYNGITIKELPMSYYKIAGASLIFSGGGYFRVIPYNIIKNLTMKSDYVMSYFHPRDFDNGQPVIKELSLFRKFKSYYGLGRSITKFNRYITDFQFVDINTAVKLINWDKVKIIDL
jgi:polysaccharide deacetylase family protein (PEP-CTERM system associated)